MFPINRARKRRLWALLGILLVLSTAVALALSALRHNINLYRTPMQLSQPGAVSPGTHLSVGGMVCQGSVRYLPGRTPKVQFALTDGAGRVSVHFAGILPDLFREGQGIVVRGVWTSANTVEAEEVLAKHDERYVPKEVAEAMKKVQKQQEVPHVD